MSIPLPKKSVKFPDIRPQSLRSFNTLGLHSHASAFMSLDDVAALPALADHARRYSRLQVLGGGSNVVLPAVIDDLVLHIDLRGVTRLPDTPDAYWIEVAAGESWHGFVTYCVTHGLNGLENLALIPGQVGAAPVQNIGAYGLEVGERIAHVHVWDRHTSQAITLSARDCAFAYRDSRFKQDPDRWIITSVVFRLPRIWTPLLDYPDLQRHPALANAAGAPTARDVYDAVVDIRRAKLPDPAQIGNAGSFFKNPIVDAPQYVGLRERFPSLVAYAMPDGRFKLAAGWLIDQAGWRGQQVGRAAVHDRQALVLTNAGGADAQDVLALARAITADVQSRYGVTLSPEPVIVPGRPVPH